MFNIDQMLQTTLLMYIFICIIIYQLNHHLCLLKMVSKQIGVGKDKTIYPFLLVTFEL